MHDNIFFLMDMFAEQYTAYPMLIIIKPVDICTVGNTVGFPPS